MKIKTAIEYISWSTDCPHKPSQQGNNWYLTSFHDSWVPQRCSDREIFSVESCKCIADKSIANGPSKRSYSIFATNYLCWKFPPSFEEITIFFLLFKDVMKFYTWIFCQTLKILVLLHQKNSPHTTLYNMMEEEMQCLVMIPALCCGSSIKWS